MELTSQQLRLCVPVSLVGRLAFDGWYFAELEQSASYSREASRCTSTPGRSDQILFILADQNAIFIGCNVCSAGHLLPEVSHKTRGSRLVQDLDLISPESQPQ